jgi:hypothetical protein
MEWSEFTQYIIDAVIGEKEAKFVDCKIKIIKKTKIIEKNSIIYQN